MRIFCTFKYIFFTACCVFLPPTLGIAQSDSMVQERPFDEAEWRKRTEHLDYSEARHVAKEQRNFFDIPSFDLPPVVGMVLKIIFIIGLLALLVFLLVRIAGTQGFIELGSRKIRAYGNRDITLENIDENVLDATFEPFIQQALATKNYALAIRLYYLWLIKDLSSAEKIVWKKEKTNAEYIRDIENSELSRPFRNLTNIYERTWYGEWGVDEAEFKKIEPQFKALLAKLAA
jgi:hypothetical protein